MLLQFSSVAVSRRYKQFDWLQQRLVEKFSTIAIPPLPEKQIAGMLYTISSVLYLDVAILYWRLVAFGQSSFTDLDFTDDVSLLAELLELLVPILETMASETASLGFEVNWQKTKVQTMGCREICH